MTSKERVMSAISLKEPDHIPLHFRNFYIEPPPPFKWKDSFEEADWFLSRGMDSIFEVSLPFVTHHPDVRTRYWKEKREGEKYEILCKEYDTPAGILRHEVYKAEDIEEGWHGQPDDVPLLEDFNIARGKKHPATGPDDLPKLRYILHEPSEAQLASFREYMKRVRSFADERQFATMGWCAFGADTAVYLMGIEGAILSAIEQPDFFQELLDHIHKIDLCHFEILIEEDVDILMRRAWFENTRIWSPALYRKFIVPHFKELVKMAHDAGKKIAYNMDCGIMPLLDDFLDIGFDLLCNLDPVQGDADLKIVNEKLGGSIALQGGVNPSITLANNNPEEIRKAVRDAIGILSPGGGFILSVSNCLHPGIPWSAIKVMIDTWKEMR